MRHTPIHNSTRIPTLGRALVAVAGLCTAFWVQAQAVDGEVRKVDRTQHKLTLKHGEIKSLDMPPMTMVFTVADPQWLEGLAVGAKIKFDVEKRNGVLTVVRLTVQP